ncbi:single-stranded-DNA-specific exonuclease RecJ [Patescibacteria group bacterium]|nr:single-stranded-DNA-specific exonuclease RecJ [Patescibacteria group bacterium]
MRWQIKTKAPRAFFKQFPELSPLVAQLIYNRGLKTQKQVDEFFNPDYQEDIHDPFLLKDMSKAVKRINRAIKKKEKITIYGDFDTDGICSSAIVYLTLKELGVKNLNVYIPDRAKENHGLNEKSVKNIAKKGAHLIIVVDCASTDLEEADLVKSLGMDLIITDHHTLGKKIPQTIAFVNFQQKGDKYPFKELSGAGVAYKLVCALLSVQEKRIEHSFKKWLLDLVAIATVVDMMPIVGENRTLVKYGLGVLAQTRWIGLQELMKIAKINPEIEQDSINGEAPLTNLNTNTLGFVIGPRLNAASRIDHANNAFNLLVEEDREKTKDLAFQIEEKNKKRQNLTSKIFKEAEILINQKKIDSLIFEGSIDWPTGLVGLIASKLKEKYGKPAIIYWDGGDTIHASCRAPKQIDLVGILNKCSKYFIEYGGRRCTGGFRAKKENLGVISKILHREFDQGMKNLDLTPVLDIDQELNLNDVSFQSYDEIRKFEPFGRGNSAPRFLAKKLEICELRSVGNGNKHLKMELIMFDKHGEKIKKFNTIAFGLGDKEPILKKGQLINIVFEMIVNQWNGHRGLEMKIIDLKLCE